ncbi:(Fe-S)-binding protein [Effusibacillus lacus]|uniref:Fe-S oxidoreductase n=1 Tax=Effusibacillus lacus TaxID=1348429 RepID=A0A292YGC1_9BACL|nr:(Fe-S)-binding protein [Effusibacillus lacus]TCS70526.1 L-lactate dehydrogenase complex protein LldE [Effusibacillus lacus]GAX89527.1 Fe-S oxidoreductase [Effusibacillus lacus]
MKASLFITCLADSFYPNVGESTVRLLDRLGVQVDFPEGQTCCGQPAFNSGYRDEAKEVAKTMIEAFEQSEYVVGPSGSCVGMIHEYYPLLFEGDRKWEDRALKFVKKSYELTQFIVNVVGKTYLGARLDKTVTYHPSCHAMRMMGIKHEPLELLKNVQGLQLVDLPFAEDCCGFGGTFAVKMHEVSAAMVAEKAQHVLETKAEILCGTDMGCLMNIGGRLRYEGAPVRVMHVAEVLWEGVREGVKA